MNVPIPHLPQPVDKPPPPPLPGGTIAEIMARATKRAEEKVTAAANRAIFRAIYERGMRRLRIAPRHKKHFPN